jgi:ceramide glucosyltransferase
MMHFLFALQILGVVGVVTSSIYYILCVVSTLKFLRERKTGKSARSTPSDPNSCAPESRFPPISILKPLKGIDPEIYECFRSHCRQDYPEYEIIFGVSDPNDPAIEKVMELQQQFPQRRIELVICTKTLGANMKVSNLAQMLGRARYDHLIVNDSDIRVDPDYLQNVVGPLADPQVGMVTCLYRGIACRTLGSRLESLGISTDFSPGVLVAWLLEGGIRFGLGSTLAFRRIDLKKLGGFESIANYLADDYELGRRIASMGMNVVISDVVVETHLPAYRMRDFFAHQLRWARGVRDARAGGYLGLAFTFGTLWALLTVVANKSEPWAWSAMIFTLFLRFVVTWLVGWFVLRDRQAFKSAWLIPLRDLIAVVIWAASLAGHTVTWRGERFRLKDGRLMRISN